MPSNQISVYLDPTKMPGRTQDQAPFDTNMAAFFANLPTFGAQFNAGIANFNAAAAGSAYAIPYTIDLSTTADADPGSGMLRLDNATQNLTTTLRLDLLGSSGIDYTAMIDTFDASTSTVKGQIRIVKLGDASKFLMFDVTARTAPSGYRDISVTPRASTSANPFLNGDAVLLFFQRTGDRGGQGQGYTNMVVMTSTGTWTPPAGTTKARVTVQNGGYSGSTAPAVASIGGPGGNTGISIITVDPAVTYTATVGAGGAAAAAGTNTSPAPGGSSTFSGSGLTTLTTANAALRIPGGPAIPSSSGQLGGSSMYGSLSGSAGAGYGGGGAGTSAGTVGYAGAPGIVIIEY